MTHFTPIEELLKLIWFTVSNGILFILRCSTIALKISDLLEQSIIQWYQLFVLMSIVINIKEDNYYVVTRN